MISNELTEHLELLTTTYTTRSTSGRGSSNKLELTGIKKLRALILELAVRGKLVPQNVGDEPASVLVEKITSEKARLVNEGKIKKQRSLPAITDEKKPFDLPVGWEWIRLGDAMNVLNGRAYKKHEMLQEGTPLLRVGNLFTSNEWYYSDLELEPEKYIDDGDLIYAWSASFGPFIWEGGKAIYHYHIWKLDLYHEPSLSKHYLYNYLLAITEHIKASGSGIAMIHMTKERMEKLVLPIPPLAEQHRIIAKIRELMTLCDQLEQEETDSIAVHQTLVDVMLTTLTDSKDASELAENWSLVAEHFNTLFTTEASITRLRQTILQLAVMGRLVPQNPEDEPAARLLERIAAKKILLMQEKAIQKQKPLPSIRDDEKPFELPSGWDWARLEDVVDIQGGITKGRKLAGRELISVPYLRVANVQRGHLILNEVKEVEIPIEEQTKYQVKPRDLLITEGGDWDKVGRTAIWSGELPYMAHQNHVFKARILLPEQSELWLERYLNGPVARQYFAKSSKQTTNLASINKTQLRGCLIAIPPSAEKDRIVTRANDLMTLCDTLQHQVQQAQIIQQHLASALVEQAIITHNQPAETNKVA